MAFDWPASTGKLPTSRFRLPAAANPARYTLGKKSALAASTECSAAFSAATLAITSGRSANAWRKTSWLETSVAGGNGRRAMGATRNAAVGSTPIAAASAW
ncbi:hypothetical protein D3C87_1619250 [compost metagenome]